MAHSLTGAIRKFDSRLTIDFNNLHNHRKRFSLSSTNCSTKVGTDTKGNSDSSIEMLGNSKSLVNIKGVRPASYLSGRVNAQLLIMGNKHFTPTNRVTTIMSATIKQLGKLQTEILQESLETIVVRKGNTQLTIVQVRPIRELLLLSHFNSYIGKTLIGSIQFVSKGTDCRAIVLDSKVHITCSNKGRTHSKHTANHIIFPITRNGTANGEITNGKLDTCAGCSINLFNFLVKICLSLIPIKFFTIHPKSLNNVENINFPRRNILLRTFGFNEQGCVLSIRVTLDMTAFQLEIFKKFYILLCEIILLLEPIKFKLLELQSTKPIQFFINSLTKWSKVYTLSTALKFPLCFIFTSL